MKKRRAAKTLCLTHNQFGGSPLLHHMFPKCRCHPEGAKRHNISILKNVVATEGSPGACRNHLRQGIANLFEMFWCHYACLWRSLSDRSLVEISELASPSSLSLGSDWRFRNVLAQSTSEEPSIIEPSLVDCISAGSWRSLSH